MQFAGCLLFQQCWINELGSLACANWAGAVPTTTTTGRARQQRATRGCWLHSQQVEQWFDAPVRLPSSANYSLECASRLRIGFILSELLLSVCLSVCHSLSEAIPSGSLSLDSHAHLLRASLVRLCQFDAGKLALARKPPWQPYWMAAGSRCCQDADCASRLASDAHHAREPTRELAKACEMLAKRSEWDALISTYPSIHPSSYLSIYLNLICLTAELSFTLVCQPTMTWSLGQIG